MAEQPEKGVCAGESLLNHLGIPVELSKTSMHSRMCCGMREESRTMTRTVRYL